MPLDNDIKLYGGFGPQRRKEDLLRTEARLEVPTAAPLVATPAAAELDQVEATPLAIEGPYYKFYSPKRFDLREPTETGRIVELTGLVLNRHRQPMAGAVVDLWHASKLGEYDNASYRYRGHTVTDALGKYRFLTIKPGGYGSFEDGTGRTVHYHIIVRAPNVWPLTTQFYFPGEADNLRDDYFRSGLLMQVQPVGEGFRAQFDIVLETFHQS